MNKTAIVLIDTHGGYQNVNDWLYAKNPQKHDNNYINSSVISNLNVIKINKITPGICTFSKDNEVEKLFRSIRLNKNSPLEKKKTIDEMAIYLQRKLKEQDQEYGKVKKCKKDEKDIVDIINEDVRGCGLDEEVIREYNNNLKTCNRKRHRINKIVSGEKNDKILNKIYQYQTRERDKEREKKIFYRWSATALVRSNNSTKFKEIKEFTKTFEHKFFSDKYKTEFIEFSLEELLKHLKKIKVKNVLIVDLTCNDIDIDLLETIGITNEFVTEQKTKKNNTLKSCNCKEYSFFGGGSRRTRKNKNTKKR